MTAARIHIRNAGRDWIYAAMRGNRRCRCSTVQPKGNK